MVSEQEKFAEAIANIGLTLYSRGLPDDVNEDVANMVVSNVNYLKKDYRRISLPLYLAPILSFLLYLQKNHFNDKGKFKVKWLQIPTLIKELTVLIFNLIKISK